MVKAPEGPPKPKPVEKPKQPLGPKEAGIATVIAKEREDPDRALRAIAGQQEAKSNARDAAEDQLREAAQEGIKQPVKAEEASAYRITMQTLSEKIIQEVNPEAVARFRQEMANVVADYLLQLPDDRATAFIAEFNQNNPGLLKSQEFRLLQSRGEKVIIIDESGNLGEMVVTQENAKGVLADIKGKDEAIGGKSYELRREIVRRSNGEITTHEAYTYTTDLPKGNDLDPYLNNSENWVPERRVLHKQIIDEEYAKAQLLSTRLSDEELTIYALRGNIAAGKTTATRNDELFRKALDETGEPSGAIAPDTYKDALRKVDMEDGKYTLSHNQVHSESTMISRRITSQLLQEQASLLVDKMMAEEHSIRNIATMAEENNRAVKLLDLDVPLEVSCLRVLSRLAGGKDPLIHFDSIAQGFSGIRQNRASLIEQVIDNPNIKDYVLYVADETGATVKAAQKVNGAFMVIEGQEEAFKRAVSKDTDSTVAQIAGTVIDETYIGGILSRTPEAMQPKVRSSLERYKGKTMKEALDIHASKLNEES